MSGEVTIASMRARLCRMLAAEEQNIRDGEWWNENRTDAGPMDIEDFRVRAGLLRRAIERLDAGDVAGHMALVEEASANVAKAIADNDQWDAERRQA